MKEKTKVLIVQNMELKHSNLSDENVVPRNPINFFFENCEILNSKTKFVHYFLEEIALFVYT